jgi:hypothetical protein
MGSRNGIAVQNKRNPRLHIDHGGENDVRRCQSLPDQSWDENMFEERFRQRAPLIEGTIGLFKWERHRPIGDG